MNFLDIQQTLRDAIAANTLFAADAAVTVVKDNGASKHAIEEAFLTKGYSIAVWPSTKGRANQDEDAHQAANVQNVVRLCINPQQLKAIRTGNTQTDGNYINVALAAIIASVLGIAPDPAGIRFQLDPDAFELISFDEGMIAYHIRFSRVTVFGT